MMRETYSTGTKWEELAGYSRAVRVGNQIWVAGTTASGPDGVVGVGDPAAQTEFIIDRIEAALQALGGQLSDVVRTQLFVSDIGHWEAVARVHGKRFDAIRPVNTLVEARLVAPELLVEIAAEAVIGTGGIT
jgi:enamine deaminase RidA (YjgF/YER057c/UK114 family)